MTLGVMGSPTGWPPANSLRSLKSGDHGRPGIRQWGGGVIGAQRGGDSHRLDMSLLGSWPRLSQRGFTEEEQLDKWRDPKIKTLGEWPEDTVSRIRNSNVAVSL